MALDGGGWSAMPQPLPWEKTQYPIYRVG